MYVCICLATWSYWMWTLLIWESNNKNNYQATSPREQPSIEVLLFPGCCFSPEPHLLQGDRQLWGDLGSKSGEYWDSVRLASLWKPFGEGDGVNGPEFLQFCPWPLSSSVDMLTMHGLNLEDTVIHTLEMIHISTQPRRWHFASSSPSKSSKVNQSRNTHW